MEKQHSQVTELTEYILADEQIHRLDIHASEPLAKFIREILQSEESGDKQVAENLKRDNPRLLPLTTLISGIRETARSILNVLCDHHLDSAYILARVLVERTINYAFLSVCSEAEYAKWTAHSKQKSYRLLNRTQTAGAAKIQLTAQSIPEPSSIPGMEEALAQFTSQNSKREITHWTHLSLGERLAKIDGLLPYSKNVIVTLLAALVLVYDLGAEAQHGSLIGTAIRLQGSSPTQQEIQKKPAGFFLQWCYVSIQHFWFSPQVQNSRTGRRKKLSFLASTYVKINILTRKMIWVMVLSYGLPDTDHRPHIHAHGDDRLRTNGISAGFED